MATLTVGLANFGSLYPPGEWHRFADLARAADDAGVDRITVVDHVIMGPNTDAYAWGTFPVPPDAPWFEPLTMLAAIASATSRVRLATGILIAPLRPAVLLAKQAATLDQISGGRLDLGVGTGWQREEYDATGIDFDRRGRLLTDTIAACKVLWRDTPAAFASETISFRDVYCEPKPLQPDGVPLWIAGTLHRANMERVVAHGDAWIPIMGETLEGIAQGASRIRDALRAAGRDPDRFTVQAPLRIARADGERGERGQRGQRGERGAPDLARSMESVPALLDAGATDVHVGLRTFCRDPADAPKVLDELARGFAGVTG